MKKIIEAKVNLPNGSKVELKGDMEVITEMLNQLNSNTTTLKHKQTNKIKNDKSHKPKKRKKEPGYLITQLE